MPIEPADYNRSDGFSPGQAIVLKVPGLDTRRRCRPHGAVPVTDLARAYDRAGADRGHQRPHGQRQLIWAELDSNATSPAGRPRCSSARARTSARASATSWRCESCAAPTARGSPASRAFSLYRDRVKTDSRAFEQRRAHMEKIFRALGGRA